MNSLFQKLGNLSLVLAAVLLIPTSIVSAGTSDWLKGNQLNAHAKALSASNQLATRIECKSGSASSAQNGAVLFRITSRDDTSKTRWQWNWGETGAFKNVSAKIKGQGFKRVSHASFTRPSGLFIQCAIWHKVG